MDWAHGGKDLYGAAPSKSHQQVKLDTVLLTPLSLKKDDFSLRDSERKIAKGLWPTVFSKRD